MNFEDWHDMDGNPIAREKIAEGIDFLLQHQGRTVAADVRERIVDYSMAHDAVALHAIAAVLGGCCHCVDCLNKAKAPRE